MSDRKTKKNEVHVEDEYDEISDEDYGFVVGPDGELKSVFLPVEYTPDVPDTVREIFKIFGVQDIDELNTTQTKH